MLSIKTNKAFTIPKFHQTKPQLGKIKTIDLKHDSIGNICSGEILFVLDEKGTNERKQRL